MRHRTHRYRQVTAAAVLGMGMTAGVIGLSAGTAGAATSNSISAVSAPQIATTGSNLVAGDLTVTLANNSGTTLRATSTLTLTLRVPTGSVTWYAAPTVSTSGVTIGTVNASTATLHIQLTSAFAPGASATVNVTGVRYQTTTAVGTITVTPAWYATTTGTANYNPPFTPLSVVNAYATTMTPPAQATAFTATATSAPYLKATGSGQAAGNWTITVGTVTVTTAGPNGIGWDKTETLALTVATPGNCSAAFGYILFTGTPTATVIATNVSTTPKVKVATSAAPTCSAVSHSQVTVTFTNTGTFTSTTKAKNTMSIVLSGVKYDVAKGTGTAIFGAVTVAGTHGTVTVATTTAANAAITSAYVTANTPAVTVAPGAYDASVSPVKLVENTAGTVGTGYECIGLDETTGTNTFNTSSTATAKATGGNGTVTSKVFYENATGTTITTGNAAFAVFEVTGASTASASTYVVSGLAVNASTTAGTVVALAGPARTATKCTGFTASFGKATAYTIGATSQRIAGATGAATAAKELETAFDPTTPGTGTTSGQCVGTTRATHNELTTSLSTVGAKRVVVLATETHFQDALSSQYLAGYYKTGTLLTQTSTLPSVTVAALRAEGVTRVFVVGGSDAVSNTVVNELKSLPAYTCGGAHLMTTAGKTVHLEVTRLAGNSAEDTAMQIAQAVPTSHIASLALAGAYAGVNATGGNGMYNDTPGKGSAAPATAGAVKTAILASGTEFQDAMAASTFGYDAHTRLLIGGTRRTEPGTVERPADTASGLPILLTTPRTLSSAAADALVNLTVSQVIVMGGTDAVTNTVVSEVQKLGVSVLRIAGKSYTDTSAQFAKFLVNTTAGGLGAGWSLASHLVTVTRGNGYTDGLAGAVISGHTELPLLLTAGPSEVGTYLTAFLKASGKTTAGVDSPTVSTKQIEQLTIFGGSLAVTPAVVAQMQADIS